SPSLDPAIQALLSGPGGVSEEQLQLYVRTLQGFGTRHTLSEVQGEERGIGAARRWIYNTFLEVGNGRLEVRFDDFPAQVNGLVSNQRNVVATLQGRSGYEGVVLITAHYDTRGANINDGTVNAPGADDNASGIAMMLEVARVMSTRDWEQTIMFVAFAVEEQNTQGSRHFVQNVMIRNNVQIDGVINNDTIGGRVGIPQTVRMFAEGTDTSPHREFARYYR
ncbi:MAG: M20/M25/M40 family metallo-hydrolase, partial [Anaerolineales bacterium]|nr:M20/M25/M40 family metallo-hydrolase [Anaerolineales bacterium]